MAGLKWGFSAPPPHTHTHTPLLRLHKDLTQNVCVGVEFQRQSCGVVFFMCAGLCTKAQLSSRKRGVAPARSLRGHCYFPPALMSPCVSPISAALWLLWLSAKLGKIQQLLQSLQSPTKCNLFPFMTDSRAHDRAHPGGLDKGRVQKH